VDRTTTREDAANLSAPRTKAKGPRRAWFRRSSESSTMPGFEGITVETPPGEVTELLRLAGKGNQDAQNRLFQIIYPALRKLAAGKMAREKPGHTLSPTALVSEAYLRIADQLGVPWQSRTQFMAFAAVTMRRILVDCARRKAAEKHGGGYERIPLDEGLSLPRSALDEVLAIHECLERLEQDNPRQAKVVELRFFGGLSNPEIAEYMGIGLSTVEADWRFARAWLRLELEGGE
jgi:RNA polymerase sigma-70 factor, ECF subfamily